MEKVCEWINNSSKQRFEKRKGYEIIDESGKELYSSLKKYPFWWNVAGVLDMLVISVKEEKSVFVVTAKELK